MLLDEDPCGKALNGIVITNLHWGLQHDWTAVEFTGNEVDRRTCDLDTVLQRLALSIDAGKCRQQGRMDVQDRIWEGIEQVRANQPHEPSQTDERHLTLQQCAGYRPVEVDALSELSVIDNQRFDAGRPRAFKPRRLGAVRDDDRDPGLQTALGDRVDQRLEVAAAT